MAGRVGGSLGCAAGAVAVAVAAGAGLCRHCLPVLRAVLPRRSPQCAGGVAWGVFVPPSRDRVPPALLAARHLADYGVLHYAHSMCTVCACRNCLPKPARRRARRGGRNRRDAAVVVRALVHRRDACGGAGRAGGGGAGRGIFASATQKHKTQAPGSRGQPSAQQQARGAAGWSGGHNGSSAARGGRVAGRGVCGAESAAAAADGRMLGAPRAAAPAADADGVRRCAGALCAAAGAESL